MQQDDASVLILCKNIIAFLQMNEIHIRRGGPKATNAIESLRDEAVAVIELMEANTLCPKRATNLKRCGFDIRVEPASEGYDTISSALLIPVPDDAEKTEILTAFYAIARQPGPQGLGWFTPKVFHESLSRVANTFRDAIEKERSK